MAQDIRVGMAGWTYPPWRGAFYPEGLPQKKELEYASRAVTSIEINGTFYSMQKPASFVSWAKDTPADFKFSLKAPRYLTHIKRLKDYGSGLANFFATGVLRLEKKLGVILWQFPPFLSLKDSRFEDFFAVLPHSAFAAAQLASQHSPKIAEICDFNVTEDFPIRHVCEFRHASFFNPDFFQIMRKYKMGLVLADSADESVYSEDLTSDVVYLRMHGLSRKHAKGYSKKEIATLAEKVKKWAAGEAVAGPQILKSQELQKRNVFVYFDNDVKETAPKNALELLSRLDL